MGRWLRRTAALLGAALLAAAAPGPSPGPGQPVLPAYAPVLAGAPLVFPRDHGAHPQFRTEWWYVTGWLRTPDGRDVGFQVTFFRSRLPVDQRNPSAFAPKQILFAHAALSDPKTGRLLHDGRIAREGLGLARAAKGDADVTLLDWRLARGRDNRFRTRALGRELGLDLVFAPTQPVLLQGDRGFSRKGPQAGQASYYYSLPQLSVAGEIVRDGRRQKVTGRAWLDHEWSSTLLDPRAVGWDWVGLNLDDGGALTAFRVRDRDGRAIWAGGSLRTADGVLTRLGSADVAFRAERVWRSPATGGRYPIQQELTVTLPGGPRRFRLTPLFDSQELDSRRTGGPIYWEGAVRTEGGRGYLELTGYVSPLRM